MKSNRVIVLFALALVVIFGSHQANAVMTNPEGRQYVLVHLCNPPPSSLKYDVETGRALSHAEAVIYSCSKNPQSRPFYVPPDYFSFDTESPNAVTFQLESQYDKNDEYGVPVTFSTTVSPSISFGRLEEAQYFLKQLQSGPIADLYVIKGNGKGESPLSAWNGTIRAFNVVYKN